MNTASDDLPTDALLSDGPGAGHLATAWARIRARLRQEVGDVEYRTWLRQMTLQGTEDDVAIVSLPTRFLRDWVRDHYGDRLKQLFQGEAGEVRNIELRVAAARTRSRRASRSSRRPSRTHRSGSCGRACRSGC